MASEFKFDLNRVKYREILEFWSLGGAIPTHRQTQKPKSGRGRLSRDVLWNGRSMPKFLKRLCWIWDLETI